jgi:hypothetical protein
MRPGGQKMAFLNVSSRHANCLERNLPMPIRRSFRPRLDVLEDRTCPSLAINPIGPDLTIHGTPATTLAGLTITGAGGANFDVTDGLIDLGTFPVSGNLTLKLSKYNSPITLDLAGQALPGNLVLDLGAGNVFSSARPISIISSTPGGTVGGSIVIEGGSGDETVQIGAAGGTDAVGVIGSVTFIGHNTRTGNDNSLEIFEGSSIGGNVTTRLVSNIQIGESGGTGAFIGGNLFVNDSASRSDLTVSINQGSEVAGKVIVVGTSRFTSHGDQLVVEANATIVGKLTANLGSNTNTWKLGGTFDSNVLLVGGGGFQPAGGLALDTIELDDGAGSLGKFNGSLSAQIGSGSVAVVFNAGTVITGNLGLNFGNGTHDLGGGSLGGVFAGTVDGNLSITLGNGLSTAVIDTAPGHQLSWNSGAGVSNLTLGSAAPHANSIWHVRVRFGVGSNTLILDPGAPAWQFLKGSVSGHDGTDSLINTGLDWSIAPHFAIFKGF